MKIKKEYIILVVIIIALALYLTFRRTDKTHYSLPELPDVNRQDISKIEITKTGETILLKKENGRWDLEPKGYPADDVKVETMIEALDNFTLSALVSESKSYDRYDLSGEKRLSIKAWEGETLKRDFYLGKVGPSSRHTFVALSGDDRIYQATNNLRSTFDRTMDDLRDKQILSFSPANIRKIHIALGDQRLDLSRDVAAEKPAKVSASDGKDEIANNVAEPWQTPEGKRADKSKVNRLLETFSSLECQSYLDEGFKVDTADPIFAISFEGTDTCSLSVFPKAEEEDKFFPSRSSTSPYPFTLDERTITEFMGNPDGLLEKEERAEGEADPK
jgi:hypothetical protein